MSYNIPEDFRFKKRRQRLVEEVKTKGVENTAVLQVIGSLPRHIFIDSAFENRAYEDSALPIEMGQTISQPYTVARQTELLQVEKGHKVLEIGTGSGYQCAVLCALGAQVYSVERHRLLTERSKRILNQLGFRPMLKTGDGTLGWSAYAPYDRIIVTAGAPVVPEALKEQLVPGGILIIPVGDSEKQAMLRIQRISEDEYLEESFSDFKFVPLIGQDGWSH